MLENGSFPIFDLAGIDRFMLLLARSIPKLFVENGCMPAAGSLWAKEKDVTSNRTRDNPTAKRAIGSSLRRFSFPPQETVGEIKNPDVNYVKLKVGYTIVTFV